MKPGLAIGDRAVFSHRIGPQHTVPALYPEAATFQSMPAVLATGYFLSTTAFRTPSCTSSTDGPAWGAEGRALFRLGTTCGA